MILDMRDFLRPKNFVGPYCPKCILKWSRCLCITGSDWEDNVTQQIQMPRTSSPYPDVSEKRLEKLETETKDGFDQIYYIARPVNYRRLPKARQRPTLRRSPPNWLKNNCSIPQTSPKYIMMVASPQQNMQPTNEVRGILPEGRKIENHHYEELQEKGNRVVFNIQNNIQNNVQSNMQIKDEINENYELIEERETVV